MRKFLTIFIVAVFMCASVSAQNKKGRSSFGLKSGMNFSGFRTSGTSAQFYKTGWKTGFVAGFFVEMNCGSKFGVQPEVLYSAMGGELDHASSGRETDRVNYLSIPVLAKYNVAKKLNVVAGPQIDFLIQAKRLDANSNATKATEDFKDKDIGVTAGVEYSLFKCLNITARYIHGFSDVDRRSNLESRNQGIQLNVGVKL